MSAETFEAGYIGATPSRIGTGNWGGVWRLQQQVDRLINDEWPRPSAINTINFTIQSETLAKGNGALEFSADGKYFYIHKGSAGFGEIYQYECQTAWDVSSIKHIATAVLTLTNTTNIHFKNDGTKFYILSTTDDKIHQHSCATAWDIDTATYDNVSFSVGTQESVPSALFFRPDGTRFYIVGANRIIYQYSCSTAWNLSTASYSSVFLSVTSTFTTGSLLSIQFATDGTSMFLSGTTSGTLRKYNLPTAWTVSGGTLSSNESLTLVSSNTYVFFKPDGLTFFTSGGTGATQNWINVYKLRTAYSTETRVYTGEAVFLNTYTSTASSIIAPVRFNSDGTKFFLMQYSDQYDVSIHQYNSAEAWTTRNASYPPFTFSVANEEGSPLGLAFKSDGTKFYIIGTVNDRIYQYSCSTAWDVTTASYDNKSFLVSSQEGSANAIFFKNDGTKFYIVGTSTDTVYQYSCATAWDVTTASYDSKSVSVAAKDTNPTDLFIKDDGTKLYIIGTINDNVHEYTLSTAWDVSTATFTASLLVSGVTTTPHALFFSSDGTKLYVGGTSNNTLRSYTLGTPWSISTGTLDALSTSGVYDLDYISPGSDIINSLSFSPDGTKVYVLSSAIDAIIQGHLSTAWALSSTSVGLTSSFRGKEVIEGESFFFKEDGTKLYIISSTLVYQYSLSTAWDVSTASYDSKSFDFIGGTGVDLFFKNDGISLYILSGSGVEEYACSTAWDISTASATQRQLYVAEDNNYPYLGEVRSMSFSNDGKSLYILDGPVATGFPKDVYEYTMTTAWNTSTATFLRKANSAISVYGSRLSSLTVTHFSFNPDNTKMYVGTNSGGAQRGIIEFDIGRL